MRPTGSRGGPMASDSYTSRLSREGEQLHILRPDGTIAETLYREIGGGWRNYTHTQHWAHAEDALADLAERDRPHWEQFEAGKPYPQPLLETSGRD